MPLPKPSKMVSKRFKKPKLINPFTKPPPSAPLSFSEQLLSYHKPWPDLPHRKWRVRVICTDPDATDDSSADELDTSAPSCKRLIHEIFLPVPFSSVPQPGMPKVTSRPRHKHQSPNSSPTARLTKVCCNSRGTEDMDACSDAASEMFIGSVRLGPLRKCATTLWDGECTAAEEEYHQFLSEFFLDIEEKCMWERPIDGLAMPHEGDVADMLNFELDSEALTWINSLQRLP